jgi:molecular chaperone HtpG
MAQRIERQLIDGLAAIARREPEAWRRTLTRHNEALLGASLCDPILFDLLAEELTIPTSEGDLRVREVLGRSGGKVHISSGDEQAAESVCLRALKVPIAIGSRYAVLPFLERYVAHRKGELVRIGTAAGNRQLFPEAQLEGGARAWLEECLGEAGRRVVPARFSPRELPLVLVPNEEARMKERLESDEADRRIASATLSLARRYTRSIVASDRTHLFVNLDSPAIEALLRARGVKAQRAAKLLRALAGLLSASLGEVDVSRTLAEYSDSVRDMLETEV